MIPYPNRNGNSSVESYLITDVSIKVKFRSNSKIYVYYFDQNAQHATSLTNAARAGHGLGGYIGRHRDSLKFSVEY